MDLNIALVLSGQPRGIPESLSQIKDKLITPNGVKDVFLHMWYDPELSGKPFNTAQPHQANSVGKYVPGSDEIILNELNPRGYIFEPQREFPWARSLKTTDTAVQESLVSMFYSMYQANELKKNYELKNEFKYDVVIRTRLDLYYFHPIIIANYLDIINENLVTSLRFQSSRMDSGTLTDIFAFSNSRIMDVFASVYPNYLECYNNSWPPFGENILGYWVRTKNSVSVAMVPLEYEILHRVVPQ